jgi:GT2 family glycosyltransferase
VKNIAMIPTKNKLEWTAPLVEHLLLAEKLDEVWVYDNGSRENVKEWVFNRCKIDSRLSYIDASSMRLYDMWNNAIKNASVLDNYVNLAILNNDIRLPHNSIDTMSKLMRKDNYKIAAIDPTRPAIFTPTINIYTGQQTIPTPIEPFAESMSYRNRIGWAFIVAAEWWKNEPYAIHPDLIIWYGDNDLYARVAKRKGKICWIRGVGCDHAMEQSDSEYPSKWEDAEKDKQTYERLWK